MTTFGVHSSKYTEIFWERLGGGLNLRLNVEFKDFTPQILIVAEVLFVLDNLNCHAIENALTAKLYFDPWDCGRSNCGNCLKSCVARTLSEYRSLVIGKSMLSYY